MVIRPGALQEDDFADFASATPEAPPLSPGSAARDRPLSEDDFAEPAPPTEQPVDHASQAAGGVPAGDAFATVNAAEQAQSDAPSGIGAIDVSSIAQQNVSVPSKALALTEPVFLSTTSAAETDAFAAFSPARASMGEAGAADWGAEAGFGDFAAATDEASLAAKLAAAGVAVSPKVVVRDWCEHLQT